MLKNDNLRLIPLVLCWFYTNDITASVIKPDILEGYGKVRGLDLSDKDIRKFHIWDQGIVPYYIDDYSFDKVLRDRIRSYLDQLNKVTGLHFMEIPQPPEDERSRWVLFLNRKGQLGCHDVAYKNFTNKGVQRVVLGYDCLTPEDLDEIILTLVGVPPQHNSPDRDDYVTVNWDNILPDKHYLFEKMKSDEWSFGKLKYDFSSAGHYRSHKYTSNGGETITPKNVDHYMEGRKGLSPIDVKKIRMFYNYIAFKDKKPARVPECKKLFVPGKNFSKYTPPPKVSVKPDKPEIPCSSENSTRYDCQKNKDDKKDEKEDRDAANDIKNKDDEKEDRDAENDVKNKDDKNDEKEDRDAENDIKNKDASKGKEENIKNDKDSKSGENNDNKDNTTHQKSTKEKEIISKEKVNSKEKVLLLSKYKEVEKIKTPKTMKSKVQGSKPLNSEEKNFLELKYDVVKKDKDPDTKKEKSQPLASEDENIEDSKKFKGKTNEDKSLNRGDKKLLVLNYKDIAKNKYPKTKKTKSKPLTSEDDGVEYSKKYKGKTDDNESIDSEEKYFLSQKYNAGIIESSEGQKTKSKYQRPEFTDDEKKPRLLKGNASKLKKHILNKSDYGTGEENVKFHFQ